jgi:beta-lactam-binding protein with PASTA domain/sugar lactone lactonase YvrE
VALRKGTWTRLIAAVVMLSVGAGARAGELQVAAANSDGNSLYDLTLSSSGLISGSSALNTDGSKHGSFQSLAYLPNAVTGTLDLIVADAQKQAILRYSGPKYGTSTTIYSWPGLGKGPAQPQGISVDSAGDIFVISSSCGFDGTASLWVLPVNTQGGYGAPILIDRQFGGLRTSALSETLIASTKTKLWNAGDLLVLVGDPFDARVLVYSQQAIAGVMGHPTNTLKGPTSTAVPWLAFAVELAVPAGMDIWPADATHGPSLLFTTIDGRILRFDTNTETFDPNFASGLGPGLRQIKVAANAGVEYAFVAQTLNGNHGQILQFKAPPSSGPNKPVASLSSGVSDPIGLAVTSSSSEPATSCISSACTFLGGALTLQFSGPGASKIGGNILEQACVVQSDPRVTVSGTSWSCSGATLDVSTLCPAFPSTVLPGFLCGHSGSSGAGFVVVKGTALGVDPVDNNTQIVVQSNIDAILPGPLNQNCSPLAAFAWAPRPDLPGNEGTIVEDAVTHFFIDLAGACDVPQTIARGASMTSFGLALNTAASGLPTGLPGFIDAKYTNLLAEVGAASITPSVAANLDTYIGDSKTAFDSGVAGAPNGFSCAAYWADYADTYLRGDLTAFSSNLTGTGGNPNPAFDISGRLANLFISIETRAAGLPANPTWPPTSVPACVTLTASPNSVPAGTASTLSWTALGVPAGSSCKLSGGTFNNKTEQASGSVSTGNLTTAGSPYTFDLTCPGTGTATSFDTATATVTAATTVAVPNEVGKTQAAAQSDLTAKGLLFSVTPQASTIVAIGTVISQSPASGNVNNGSTVTLYVSSGETVPNVVNDTQAAAQSALTSAGFSSTVTYQTSSTVAVGKVISQNPAAGTSANGGSAVNIFVSGVSVPNVVNDAQSTAQSTLSSAGFTSTVTTQASTAIAVGTVISQTPASGTIVGVGSAVTIVVSSGVAVPNVVNDTQAAAQSALTSAGFSSTVTYQTSSTVAVGNVISQNPVAGAGATYGSAVTIFVSGVAVPNVVNDTYNAAYNTLNGVSLSIGVTLGASSTIASGSIISENPAAGTVVAAGTPVTLVESNGPAAGITTFSSPQQITATSTPSVTIGSSVALAWAATGNSCNLSADGVQQSNLPVTESSYTSPPLTQLGSQEIDLACLGGGATPSETDQTIYFNVVEPNPLYAPQGTAFSSTGNFYVATTIPTASQQSGEILVYTPSASGLIQATSQTIGPALNSTTSLQYPGTITFDSHGNLYVADLETDQIFVLSLSSAGTPTLLNTITLPVQNEGEGGIYYCTPVGIAVDTQGYVYVSCNGGEIGSYIYVYQNYNATTPMLTWTGDSNSSNGSNGYFANMYGMTLDGSSLLVGVSYNYLTVQVVSYALTDLLSATANAVSSSALPAGVTIQPPPSGDENAYPSAVNIAVDTGSNIYIATTWGDYTTLVPTYPYAVASYSPIVYDSMTGAPSGAAQTNPTGEASTYLAPVPAGASGANPPLTGPGGLTVDSSGNLYVSNTQNNTVDVYTASAGAYLYDVLPLITLTVTPADSGYTLTWTSLGILPSNASCTLTTTDGAYTNTTEQPQNSTGVPVGYAFGTATLSCPGAVATVYQPYGD